MKNYDHKKIEKKWQGVWEKSKIYEAKTGGKGKSFYGLIEFPYPSGAGLHVGHIRSNTAMDIITRKRRMEGYNVLYPIGWDAFGLPTENYAIKMGIDPAKVTKTNTDIFRKQLKSVGFGFDWSREINTTDPGYVKWTQWIFLQMYKKGLAYKKRTEINWCEKCKIGLANEEVVAGVCERCGGSVVKKEKEQWMLAITKYADRLDKDLDDVNYLEKIKIQQRNWIGKSQGSEIEFKIKDSSLGIKVFTTRADTIFGATYVVVAPEHELVTKLKSQISNLKEVENYIKEVKNRPDIERMADDKEKTGVELKGVKAINPANKEEVSVWIADYVLATYGTGAVMAVPAHDERDLLFAKKHYLSIRQVIAPHFIETANPPILDKPTKRRKTVHVILERKTDGKILVLDWIGKEWGTRNPHTFIIGGVEKDEDIVEAAKREVEEETGYINFTHDKSNDLFLHTEYYAAHKQENRYADITLLHFILKDEKQRVVDKEELKKHTPIWIEKKDLLNFINVVDGPFEINWFNNGPIALTEEGLLINSGEFNDLTSEDAREKITEKVSGKIVTKYKLRDWVFSRQRYWGEPIPIIHCAKCGYVPVPERDLPVVLPKVKSYVPTDNGESPLAIISKWVNTTCPKCKGKAKRETDTMPNWAGSSWYFLRYTDSKNKKEFAGRIALKYWMKNGVDWYNGGMEHTTLHLLYSRFWHKFLYDLKLVPTSEPYMKRTSHGMILAEGGVKMSKSIGNTIDPKDIVNIYGADTLRIYEMFIGPFDQSVAWSTESIIGSRRFLDKVFRLSQKVNKNNSSKELQNVLHKTIKKIGEDIESMSFNTAISSMMILVNEMEKAVNINEKDFKTFLQILAPFAPHITEEIWSKLREKKSIHKSSWPKWDEKKIVDETTTIGVQINGKVRTEISILKDIGEDEIRALVLKDKKVLEWIGGAQVKRIIYVKGRIVNIVV